MRFTVTCPSKCAVKTSCCLDAKCMALPGEKHEHVGSLWWASALLGAGRELWWLRGPLWRADIQPLDNLCSWMGVENKSVCGVCKWGLVCSWVLLYFACVLEKGCGEWCMSTDLGHLLTSAQDLKRICAYYQEQVCSCAKAIVSTLFVCTLDKTQRSFCPRERTCYQPPCWAPLT